MIGHNNPPIETAADLPDGMPKMHFFKCDIQALRKATIDKPLDIRGAYLAVILALYEHMEPLPADDRQAMLRTGIHDSRVWRRVKGELIRLGLVHVRASGRLTNPRFEEEITAYVVEFRNRQKAAIEREQKARVARAPRQSKTAQNEKIGSSSAVASPQLSDSYAVASPQLAPSSALTNSELSHSNSKKRNEINTRHTTIVPEPSPRDDHESRIRARVLELELDSKESVCVSGARPGEEEVSPGLYVNCDTIRHIDFAISIPAIVMQLATANLGLSKNEVTPLARQSAIAHAMQWATEIGAGKPARQVLPTHIVNFIRGAVISQHNRQLAQKNTKAQPWRGGRAPPNKPSRSEVLDAFHELEAEAQGATYRRID